ncbi:probable phosphoglycerate mutase [Fontibacillus panacisegetis]|uniref:Probable phosphoglycerate mutase n=1 Tax=Fontibacillus panacisegetis TaxID=670482 RepID=A0A1G7P0J9_9BACL|nr:histidine phosphatase family protein [Fontibacillus panacisegetis]SDF79637.1 probable phosphoglycerate mutase [Fontibacillus panacisegetis]
MNKTTIFLVRHGQTEWNVEHRFQGHQDSPLTELGVKQASWLGESIQNEWIDAIFSSSSNRARRTAEIIKGNREIDIHESDDLREMNLGIWEGQKQEAIMELYPEEYDYFWGDPEKFQVYAGETYEEVLSRAVRKLNQIIADHQGKSILIVTHTVVVKLIMAYFEKRPMNKLWDLPYIHPACLCKVEITDNEYKIILHGDISHYQEDAVEG